MHVRAVPAEDTDLPPTSLTGRGQCFYCDGQDQIQWFNRVAAEYFGLDPARDRRQRMTNLVRAPAFVAHLQSGPYDEAASFPSPAGSGVIAVVVHRYEGAMKLVLSEDTNERERSDKMRRDFVANVWHENRSPLTVLAGFVETLDRLPLTEVER